MRRTMMLYMVLSFIRFFFCAKLQIIRVMCEECVKFVAGMKKYSYSTVLI